MSDRHVNLITNDAQFSDATALGRPVNSIVFVTSGTVQAIGGDGVVRTIPTTGTSAPTFLTVEDTTVGGVTTVLAINHALSSGDPVAGIGTRLEYLAHCVGGPKSIGSLSFLTTDIGTDTVTAEFRVRTKIAGTSADRFKVDAQGMLCPSLDDTYDLGTRLLRWRAGYFSVSVMTPVLSVLVGATETPVASLSAPAAAVTFLQLASNTTGLAPSLSAISAVDADVGLTVAQKGTGTLNMSVGATGSLQLGGHASAKIGEFGVLPTGRALAIPNPTGGGTVDTECRAALVALLDYFRLRGTVTP